MGLDRYIVTTPATTYPVTLAEAKAFCKITHTAEDDLINLLIQAATAKLELFTNRVFIQRTYTGYFETLECSKFEKGYFITLRRAPFVSLTSFEVTEDEAQTTVSSDDYDIKDTAAFPRIVFNGNDYYSPDPIPYPWQVVFIAGYGAADDVPEPIKLMIKQYVCFLYLNRGDCGDAVAMPEMVKMMAKEYRIVNTLG